MTLPINFPFAAGNEMVNISELRNAYRSTARALNGFQNQFNPVVIGLDAEGNGRDQSIYQINTGIVQITNQIVDYWFDVVFQGHTGSGSAALFLPINSRGTPGQPWVFPALVQGDLAATDSAYFLQIAPTTNVAVLKTSKAQLPITANGQLSGHLRYIAKSAQS